MRTLRTTEFYQAVLAAASSQLKEDAFACDDWKEEYFCDSSAQKFKYNGEFFALVTTEHLKRNSTLQKNDYKQ